jgi:hypothetical protein
VKRAVLLVAAATAGWMGAMALRIHGIEESGGYRLATGVLLAIGLYGSTSGIDLREARANLRTILLAATVGVLAKAALIGAAVSLVLRDPSLFVLGVVVAQIDPLSVASVTGASRMSERAKSILASWASFDDPVTVILTLSLTSLGAPLHGQGGSGGVEALGAYVVALGGNLGFAAAALVLWRAVRQHAGLAHAALGVGVAVAVWRFWMLGLALSGLFFRPAVLALMPRLSQWALAVVACLLGMLLTDGVDLRTGLALGCAAYIAQVMVALPLTVGLPATDRAHLALAQQNGVTAMVLALILEPRHRGVVGIVAPAILATNCIHLAANRVIERRFQAQL